MLRNATSQMKPLGASWMHNMVMLRAHALLLSKAALQGCSVPDAQNWCPGMSGGPLVQSADIGNVVDALHLGAGHEEHRNTGEGDQEWPPGHGELPASAHCAHICAVKGRKTV